MLVDEPPRQHVRVVGTNALPPNVVPVAEDTVATAERARDSRENIDK